MVKMEIGKYYLNKQNQLLKCIGCSSRAGGCYKVNEIKTNYSHSYLRTYWVEPNGRYAIITVEDSDVVCEIDHALGLLLYV